MLKNDHSIVLDTTLAHLSTLFSSCDVFWGMATRQTSSSGKTKSPRIQVVLPEELCVRLSALADQESRTVSNMAKVLIQQGLQRLEQGEVSTPPARAQASVAPRNAEQIRSELEAQPPRRLRGAPRRLRLYKPS